MKLLALRCPQCAQPLAAEHDDVVLVCANCHTAVHIDEGGLVAIEAHYAAPRQKDVAHWLPFWIFHGRVYIDRRATQSGRKSVGQQAEQFWQEPRRLYLPAWELSLRDARELGRNLVRRQPVYQAIPRPAGARFQAATVTPDDALKLLEFIILTIEARRKDWLKELQFRLEMSQPELWALPARQTNRGWQIISRTE